MIIYLIRRRAFVPLTFVLPFLLCFVSALAADDEQQELLQEDGLPAPRLLQTSSTSTQVNIWQKLKESLGLTIVGIILIVLMPCLIWKNEGNYVRELKRINVAKNKAVDVNSYEVDEGTVGRLVHFVGDVNVGDATLDFGSRGGKLNVARPVPKALLLKRTCYIYQKFETAQQTVDKNRVGGGETRTTTYTMSQDWTLVGPQPEQLPHLQETNSRGIWDSLMAATDGGGNQNAASETAPMIPQFLTPEQAEKLGMYDPNKAPHAQIVSSAAHVGGFGLSSKIVQENPQAFLSELLPVPNEYLPDSVDGCEGLMKGSDNILRTFPEGEDPRNGDCKVVFEYVMDGFECSFVVEQTAKTDPEAGVQFGVEKWDIVDDSCTGQVFGEDLGDIWMVRRGKHDLSDMIDMAKQDQKMVVKMIRIVAWVVLCAGWVMLFSPFTTALEVLPVLSSLGYFAVVLTAIIVSLTCCFTVTTLAYIRYRPLLALGLLTIAGGIWGLVAWRLNIAAETGG